MKKHLFLLTILFTASCAIATVTIGVEPPQAYINDLKTCKPSTNSITSNGRNYEYKIKGKVPNGRCEVIITEKYDWSNPQTEKDMKTILGAFSNMAGDNNKISTAELDKAIDEVKKEPPDITTCRFSQAERDELIKAYNKHDGKQEPGNIKRDAAGNLVSFKGSFSTDKMSSYDNIMLTLSTSLCNTNDDSNGKGEVYSCEYADTTCYYKKYDNGVSTLNCTKSAPQESTFFVMDKVKEHVAAGYCERVF